MNEYFASLESIDASIEQNALATFKELIGIWNTGRLPVTGRRKEAAEKRDDERGLLINILADCERTNEEVAVTF